MIISEFAPNPRGNRLFQIFNFFRNNIYIITVRAAFFVTQAQFPAFLADSEYPGVMVNGILREQPVPNIPFSSNPLLIVHGASSVDLVLESPLSLLFHP